MIRRGDGQSRRHPHGPSTTRFRRFTWMAQVHQSMITSWPRTFVSCDDAITTIQYRRSHWESYEGSFSGMLHKYGSQLLFGLVPWTSLGQRWPWISLFATCPPTRIAALRWLLVESSSDNVTRCAVDAPKLASLVLKIWISHILANTLRALIPLSKWGRRT